MADLAEKRKRARARLTAEQDEIDGLLKLIEMDQKHESRLIDLVKSSANMKLLLDAIEDVRKRIDRRMRQIRDIDAKIDGKKVIIGLMEPASAELDAVEKAARKEVAKEEAEITDLRDAAKKLLEDGMTLISGGHVVDGSDKIAQSAAQNAKVDYEEFKLWGKREILDILKE